MRELYFDHNATTPLVPEVLQAMAPLLNEDFGNPSSGHAWGLAAKEALEAARNQVADLIHATPAEIHFFSCATEANNTVLFGLLGQGGHLAVSAVEHPSVLGPARELERRGVRLSVLPVGRDGVLDIPQAQATLSPDTRLVSVMLANNETGAIQPVWELSAPCRACGAALHTDAAQAVGKIPVDVRALGVDYLTIAGHKLNAPKGIGALFVRKGCALPPLLFGGGQEQGLRPGTENVAFCVGLGASCAVAGKRMEEEMARRRSLGDVLLDGLYRLGVDFMVFSEQAQRLPNTLLAGFRNLPAGRIVEGLALRDVAVSAGAACHGPDQGELSHVLAAMHAPRDYALGAVRFSWGQGSTNDDALELVSRLGKIFNDLKAAG